MITTWWIATIFYECVMLLFIVLWSLVTFPSQTEIWRNTVIFNDVLKIVNYATAMSGYWGLFVLLVISSVIMPIVDISTYETFYDDTVTPGSS